MLDGVALPLDRFSALQVYQHGLTRRVHTRGGALEVQFLARDAERLLPVLVGGELQVVTWGNRRGESDKLPPSLWTQLGTIEAGGWADAGAEEVVIPAALGLDGGIWFAVKTGVRGLVATDEKGVKHVYAIVEPANHYYATMTKAEWMPCVIGQELGALG